MAATLISILINYSYYETEGYVQDSEKLVMCSSHKGGQGFRWCGLWD